MINQFSIGNFKAFGPDPQTVPLKPLTIIFGPNSSGKSSILHSLLFAHHAARTGDMDVVYPELAEETVDLGGFRQFIHGAQRGIGNRLSWAAECCARDLAERLDRRRSETNRQLGGPESHDWRALLADISTLKIGLTIGIPLDDKGKPTSAARPCVERMECLAGQTPIFSGFSVDGKTMRVEQVAAEHPLVERMAGSVAAAETFVLEVSHDMRDRIAREIDGLVDDLQIDTDGFLPTKLYDIGAKRQAATEAETRRPDPGGAESVARAIRRSLPRLLDELMGGIVGLVREDLFTVKYLGPLRSYPPRHIAFSEAKDLGSHAGGGHAWREMATDEGLREKVNAWLRDPARLKTPYELQVRYQFPLETIERVLREFNERGIMWGVADLINSGVTDLAEVLKDPSRVDSGEVDVPDIEEGVRRRVDTDDMYEKWQLPEFHQAAEDERLPVDLVLVEGRTKTTVSHRDVGIGISQVLPVLVNAYGSKNRILAIEQPEIHLHPALQSELADVFIESALGENKNRCILETHSEHLILRILRRIREASRQPNPSITPDDVCVLYVNPQDTGARVMEMRISKDGQFLDPWPGGFFAERLREMLGA